MRCCATCWEKQRKQRCVRMRTGVVGIYTWRCVDRKSIAKVAMARKLGVRLYWMWRNGWEFSQLVKFGSNAGKLGIRHGVQESVASSIRHPAPAEREFAVVIMVEVLIGEMFGSD